MLYFYDYSFAFHVYCFFKVSCLETHITDVSFVKGFYSSPHQHGSVVEQDSKPRGDLVDSQSGTCPCCGVHPQEGGVQEAAYR